MSTAPPILCKHPMLETLEALAGNPTTLEKMISDIESGGSSGDRLSKIENDGLLGRYSEQQKPEAHDRLAGGGWGDEKTLIHISNSLGIALAKVRDQKKPLRGWWCAGATERGIRCSVTEDADAVYFLLLTPLMDDATVADKAAFDTNFLNGLKTLAAALKAWTDAI